MGKPVFRLQQAVWLLQHDVPAGQQHGGEGDFLAIVICAPPFDPDDQVVV